MMEKYGFIFFKKRSTRVWNYLILIITDKISNSDLSYCINFWYRSQNGRFIIF